MIEAQGFPPSNKKVEGVRELFASNNPDEFMRLVLEQSRVELTASDKLLRKLARGAKFLTSGDRKKKVRTGGARVMLENGFSTVYVYTAKQFKGRVKQGIRKVKQIRFLEPPSRDFFYDVINSCAETLTHIFMAPWVFDDLLNRSWFTQARRRCSKLLHILKSQRVIWTDELYSIIDRYLQMGRSYQEAAAYIYRYYHFHKITSRRLFVKMKKYRSFISRPPDLRIF